MKHEVQSDAAASENAEHAVGSKAAEHAAAIIVRDASMTQVEVFAAAGHVAQQSARCRQF